MQLDDLRNDVVTAHRLLNGPHERLIRGIRERQERRFGGIHGVPAENLSEDGHYGSLRVAARSSIFCKSCVLIACICCPYMALHVGMRSSFLRKGVASRSARYSSAFGA